MEEKKLPHDHGQSMERELEQRSEERRVGKE